MSGEEKARKKKRVRVLSEFFVEDYRDEDGCEDEEHVAEGEAPERTRGVGKFPWDREMIFVHDFGSFGRIKGDHGVVAAAWADAYFYFE